MATPSGGAQTMPLQLGVGFMRQGTPSSGVVGASGAGGPGLYSGQAGGAAALAASLSRAGPGQGGAYPLPTALLPPPKA